MSEMNDEYEIHRDDKGRFMPGGLSRGRPIGSRNKVSMEVRKKFQQLVDSYSLEQMKLDLMELAPADRLRVMTNLLDFFIPKLNRTDHSMTISDETIIIKLPSTDDNRLFQPEDIQQDLPPTAE